MKHEKENEAGIEEVTVEPLSDNDLESIAGGAAAASKDNPTACCSVEETACCSNQPTCCPLPEDQR